MPLTIVDVEKDPYYKRGIELGLKQGIEQGIEKGKIETARRLYQMGLNLEKISEAINLPLDEVKKALFK